MKLIEANDKILRTPCQNVDFNNPPFDIIEFSKELVKFMYDNNGIGISANQVGIPYKIFAMRGDPENFVCINPRIVDIGNELISLEEGCLSYKGFIIPVKRPKNIKMRFQTPNGETLTKKFTGMTARIALHEMEHMNGKVFWNNCSRLVFDKHLKKSKVNNITYNGLTF